MMEVRTACRSRPLAISQAGRSGFLLPNAFRSEDQTGSGMEVSRPLLVNDLVRENQ